MSTLASPRSPSNSSTRLPLRASAWARVTDSQVLPTPPLPEAMASMLALVCCRSPVSMMAASVMLLFRGEKGGGLERAEGREQACQRDRVDADHPATAVARHAGGEEAHAADMRGAAVPDERRAGTGGSR